MLEENNSSTINTSARLPNFLADTSARSGSNNNTNAVQSGHSKASTQAEAKTKQNAAILQASLDVSIQSKNQPLALLLKSAITGINDLLQPQFGENAIQLAASQDNTPSGTSGRIVSLSTGFYDAFKQQHPGEDAGKVLTKFMATIRGGFEQGAKEAQVILNGMGVLSGDIASNIDRTLALVEQGYADFESAMRNSFSSTTNNSAVTADIRTVTQQSGI